MRRLSPVALALLFFLPLAPGSAGAAVLHKTFTFAAEDVTIRSAGADRSAVTLRGGAAWGEPGSPELPALGALVDLPAGERAVRVSATVSEYVSLGQGIRVRPAQTPASSRDRERPWVEADAAQYARTTWTPDLVAALGPSGSMRARALASLRLHPVQYRPATGELRLATRIEVTIETEAMSADSPARRSVPEWEREFEQGLVRVLADGPAASRQGLNPERSTSLGTADARGRVEPFTPSALPSVLGSPVKYLIITNEALRPSFETLAQWKTEQGVPSVVRTVEFINANYPYGVDLADRLRRFIREAYQQWGTVYVLLGGDTPIIPVRQARTTFFGGYNIATDLYYSDLTGNWNADGDSTFGEGFEDSVFKPGDGLDMFPEVYVGRATVETVAETQIWLQKVMNYQRTPPSSFACKALFFGEVLFPQDWSPGQSVASDGGTYAQEAISRLTGCMSLWPVRMYENHTAFPGSLPLTHASLIDSMNSGFNLMHHVGHGFRNSMSVGDGPLTNPDIKGLQNGPRASGMIYSINCTSAAIDYECIGEEFLTAPNGGAVNNIGSTNLDFPATGEMYQNEFYDLIFSDDVTRLGEAQALQKVPFVAFANYDNVHRWEQMSLILLGDPELSLWTEDPLPAVATHASAMTLNDTTIAVTVTLNGAPLANARVCVMKANEEYRVATTNGFGQVVVPFHAQSTGTAIVTVTGHNAIPYQGTIQINGTGGAAALVQRTADRTIVDAGGLTNGNGNGVLDAGETIDLLLVVRNVGGGQASTVNGSLKSLDPRAVVLGAGTSSYGNLVAGGFAGGSPYRVQVTSQGITDGDELRFRLDLTASGGGAWSEEFGVVARKPSLMVITRTLADNVPGNNNGVLETGETANVTLSLLNLTEGSGRNVTATLVPATPGVAVPDGASSYGTIGPRAQVTGDALQVQNISSGAPQFVLTVSDHYGPLFSQRIDFSKPPVPTEVVGVGSASSIAVGWRFVTAPDLAGYNVYRSLNSGGPFTKRNTIPGGNISYYQDEGLAALTRYYYYVTAIDSSGNESAGSAVISASTNPPRLYGFPIATEGQTPSSPVVGDIDGDSDLEVVVGSNVLYAWHADAQGVVDADGTERTSGDFTDLGAYYASAPAISDLDNNGTKEIVAVTYASTTDNVNKRLVVFQGDGTLRSGFPIHLGISVWSWPACGDIDGDGKKEIVFASNGTGIYAFRENGAEVRDGDSNINTIGIFKTVPATFNFGGPALADLDNDGKLDIIVATSDGRINAWRWDGTSLPGFPYGPSGSFSASPAVGDIDGDGLVEIACLSSTGVLHVIQHNGTVQPGFPFVGIQASGNSRSPSPALIDINGDGQREILCAGTDGLLRIIRNNGTAYPGWSGVRFTPRTSMATESSPVAADIDGDGQLEILIGSEDANLYGFRSDGTPFPGFPIRLDGEVRATPLVCDFDQNGNAEILLAGWDKSVYIWTYPGSYSYNGAREWVMFGHNSERTSRVGALPIVDAEATAALHTESTEGGVRLSWHLPADLLGEGASWAIHRVDAEIEGLPGRGVALPAGAARVGDELAPDATGWLAFDDRSLVAGDRYTYFVERRAGETSLVLGPYGVTAPQIAPARAFLAAAVPNPAAGAQTIAFGIPASLSAGTRTRLDLYDVRGSRVRTLFDRAAEPGRYTVAWDGRDDDGRWAAAGVYWYRLVIAGQAPLGGRLVRLEP